MSNRNRLLILAALVSASLAGCHLISGPHEGRQEWWYFCDQSGCYRCTVQGCEIPGSYCSYDGQCPAGMTCDPYDSVCKSKNECQTTSQCGSGYVCTGGKCVPARTPCDSNQACGDGAYCSNGTCKNTGKCANDSDCKKFGTNYECDSRGTCVPGAPPVASCQSGSACGDGLCVDGSCASCTGDCGGGKTCQFNKHCGDGRVCLDGQCTSSCKTKADCGAGQTCDADVCVPDKGSFCLKNADCGSGKVCANNACYEDCTLTGKCSSAKDACGSTLTLGSATMRLCFPDYTARPECKVNKDCTGGELCVNAVCRTSCAKTEDCAVCPDGPVCGPGGFCMTAEEAAPQCTTNAGCSDGKVCLNGQCKAL
jgi:hypothetical protein